MPAFPNHTGAFGVPNTVGMPAVRTFREIVPIFEERNYTITGVTRDKDGVAIAGCTVYLYNWGTKALEQTTTSDASGNYSFNVDKTAVWRVLADNAAGTLTGISSSTLAGA